MHSWEVGSRASAWRGRVPSVRRKSFRDAISAFGSASPACPWLHGARKMYRTPTPTVGTKAACHTRPWWGSGLEHGGITVLPQTIGYGGAKRKTPHELDPLTYRKDIERVGYKAAVHDAVQPYRTFFVDMPSATPAGGHIGVKARRFCRLIPPKLANFLLRHPRRSLTLYEASL